MPKWDSDKIFSVSAFVISVATLATLVYQSQIMREHQEKTSFPKLELWSNVFDTRYQLVLKNTGMGPAIIEDVKIEFNNVPYDLDPAQFAKQYLDSIDHKYPLNTSAVSKGRIIEPGDEILPISISTDSIHQHPIAKLFKSKKLNVVIRYSSVYQQLWEITGTGSTPRFIDEDPIIIQQLLGD